jgi:hypothetical protein
VNQGCGRGKRFLLEPIGNPQQELRISRRGRQATGEPAAHTPKLVERGGELDGQPPLLAQTRHHLRRRELVRRQGAEAKVEWGAFFIPQQAP